MSDVIVAKLRLITFKWNAKADYLTFRKRGYKNTFFPGKSDSVFALYVNGVCREGLSDRPCRTTG